MTMNRIDYKPGGMIMVAIPSDDAGKFAKKYGTDFQGRNLTHPLTGTLIAAGGHGPDQGGRMWLVDTTGKAAALIKDKKLEGMEDGGPENGPGKGPWMGGEGRFGPKPHGPGPN